jgi:hypothetical protein
MQKMPLILMTGAIHVQTEEHSDVLFTVASAGFFDFLRQQWK